MSQKSFEDLVVWQKAIDLAENIYRITDKFPKEETYGVISQIRRSAVSVPSNIAEGAERESVKEFLRFLNVANGSIAELKTQWILSYKVGFVSEEIYSSQIKAIDEIAKMTRGLKKSLKKTLETNN